MWEVLLEWNLFEGLLCYYCDVILCIIQYFCLWLIELGIGHIVESTFYLIVHAPRSYVIHSHSCRDLCSNVGVYSAWVIAAGAGRVTST